MVDGCDLPSVFPILVLRSTSGHRTDCYLCSQFEIYSESMFTQMFEQCSEAGEESLISAQIATTHVDPEGFGCMELMRRIRENEMPVVYNFGYVGFTSLTVSFRQNLYKLFFHDV